jgi:hypothetical protein
MTADEKLIRKEERNRWARYCDGLVLLIRAGQMTNASAVAAFTSFARSLRECTDDDTEAARDSKGPN